MLNLEEMTGLAYAMGPIAEDACRLTLQGGIAVRTGKGYRTFNPDTKSLVNVTDFNVGVPGAFYTWPTRSLQVGDVFLFDGRFKCVVENCGGTVKCLDYSEGMIQEVVPESSLILGRKFYGKIVNLLGGFRDGKMANLAIMAQALGGGMDTTSMLPLMLLGDRAEDDEGSLKTFLLMKVMQDMGGAGNSNNSLLPLMLLGKGTDIDTKQLLLMQMLGGNQGQMNPMALMLMGGLGEGGCDLFEGLFDAASETAAPKRSHKKKNAPAEQPAE